MVFRLVNVNNYRYKSITYIIFSLNMDEVVPMMEDCQSMSANDESSITRDH